MYNSDVFCISTYIYTDNKILFNHRGGMLYQKDPFPVTWIKHVFLLIGTPAATIARVVAHIFLAIGAAFQYVLACASLTDITYHILQIKNSLCYGAAMLCCNIAGLVLPTTFRYFYGDCERLLNNHHLVLQEDDKSLGARLHEGFYLAQCFQPICSDDNNEQIQHFANRNLARLISMTNVNRSIELPLFQHKKPATM
ncbi:MAG: hypothetical protein HY860_00735 [Chlamydiales bacterium]|nr:hypothetical protein [Chlamydiales bacterium]